MKQRASITEIYNHHHQIFLYLRRNIPSDTNAEGIYKYKLMTKNQLITTTKERYESLAPVYIFGVYVSNVQLVRALFVTVRTGMAYREMKLTKVYLVCQYCISMINYSWRTGTFSRETLRMNKIRGHIIKIFYR